MLLLVLALAAISVGMVLVLADDRVGKRAARGPEAGAAMARMLGMILLVCGGLAFLTWTR
jgi:threonine/homoserine/homoserine lactone efflux protein